MSQNDEYTPRVIIMKEGWIGGRPFQCFLFYSEGKFNRIVKEA